MREEEPSRTALGVAAHRAAHQLLEGGRIFADPFAVAITGADAQTIVRTADRASAGLRLFVSARAAVAEAVAAEAFERRGAAQVVVLGAGLDTYALRHPQHRVFEVDFPATQAWKRRRLAEAGITPPAALTFVGVNFETDSLMQRLITGGFDPARRTVFVWLGVVMYLSLAAIDATLGAIAALPGGAEVVFDYSDPTDTLPAAARAVKQERERRVAEAGEPMVTSFDPPDLHARLRRLGFTHIDDLGPPQLEARYFRPGEPPSGRTRGGHVIHAATRWPPET